MEDFAGHAFISYVREDSGEVDRLQRILEAAGIPVWRDTANLWPGENWSVKIKDAITRDALVFIACFSSRSVSRQKSYQNQELMLAVEQLRLRRPDDPWLIPVRFDACDVPDLELGPGRTLASIHRADLFGEDRNRAAGRLVAAVLRLLGSGASAPAEGQRARFDLSNYRFVEEMDMAAELDRRPDLLALTPTELEHLVRQLFEAMGMTSWVTQASTNERVDVVAINDDPIAGGLYIIQVKRYTSVVGLESVYALAGLIEEKRATKGVLVTTSWVGKASRDFVARHGRIQVIEGRELRYLLKEHLGVDAEINLPRPRRD
jgi:Restriction endonuclease/TIR domain